MLLSVCFLEPVNKLWFRVTSAGSPDETMYEYTNITLNINVGPTSTITAMSNGYPSANFTFVELKLNNGSVVTHGNVTNRLSITFYNEGVQMYNCTTFNVVQFNLATVTATIIVTSK